MIRSVRIWPGRVHTLMFWVVLVMAGCSDAVQLMRISPSGGIVTYSYKEDRGGPIMSRYRKDAHALMEQTCPTGYRIVREGETRGYTSVSGIREGTEDEGIGRKWGIQFECKGSHGRPEENGRRQSRAVHMNGTTGFASFNQGGKR